MVGLGAGLVGGTDATGQVMGLKLQADKTKPDTARLKIVGDAKEFWELT